MEAYFDNAATTKPYSEVADYLKETMLKDYANPSSLHKMAFDAKKHLDYSAEQILKVLKLTNRKVIFTSGATESTNLAIKGTLDKYDDLSKIRIITSEIEHPCVSEVFQYCHSKGAETIYVPADQFGKLNERFLFDSITPNTRLISIIWVNNEFGSVQNLTDIIKKIKSMNDKVLIHIDAVQGFGKVLADLSEADMISISAHKFHGPKGIGALILKKSITLVPQMLGGGQQDNIRSGTINAPLIAAMGKACELIPADSSVYIRSLQSYLYKCLLEVYGDKIFNTKLYESEYAPHIMNISFEGLKGEVILHMLEEKGIYISTSSACSSHKKNHVSVLSKIGLTQKRINGTIRISLSEFNTLTEIDYLIDALTQTVAKLYKIKGNNR